MAIFTRHESEGRLHCEVKLYFSPAANVIAKRVEAMPCAKPVFDGLDIFAGTKKAWSILFSKNGP